MYVSLQGRVEIAKINAAGKLGPWRWVGNVPEYNIGSEVSTLEHKESYTGQKAKDLILITELNSSLSITLEDFIKDNMALATRGTASTITAGSVTNEILDYDTADVIPGLRFTTAKPKVSNLVITDSNGAPATVPAAQYVVEDADFGMVRLDTDFVSAGLTLPLKLAYTSGAADQVAFFTEGANYYAIRLNGVNLADSNKKMIIEYYRVNLTPASEIGWITDEVSSFPLEGTALVDATKPANGALGQIGRIVYL